MSVLDEFTKKKPFAVCVDSDGCAMDTMNIKHIRCFGPCMVEEWKLEAWKEEILNRWNVINLYSGTRGINRFKGLSLMLSEIHQQYTPIDGVKELADWVKNAPELSNAALKEKLSGHPVFQKALHWSEEVNRNIRLLPEEEVKPFPFVREALQQAHELADVVVVSSANPEAVSEEWTRFGLIESVDLLCTQDLGSKAYCISRVLEKGYERENVLMIGDAPGDEKAAEENGVLYFPILVNHEAESWQEFLEEGLKCFTDGKYTGAYQEERIRAFRKNLGME